VLVCISVLNEKNLCIFLSDSCMCLRNIKLECAWIHDCLGASKGMSMSKKIDCIVLQERRVSILSLTLVLT
jgi:hypothetical protein